MSPSGKEAKSQSAAASAAAGFVIVTQLGLVASGNLAWLNRLAIVLALPVVGGSATTDALGLPAPPRFAGTPTWYEGVVWRPPCWWRC